MEPHEQATKPDALAGKLRDLPDLKAPPSLAPRVLAAVHADVALHARLCELPDSSAPVQLVPAVLSAIAARTAPPWWRQPWLAWPRVVQVASAVLAFAALCAAGWFGNELLSTGNSATGVIEGIPLLESSRDILGALLKAVVLLAGSVPVLYAALGLVLVATAYLAFVGMGTLCVRLAFNKR